MLGRTLLIGFRWGVFLLTGVFLYAQLTAPKGKLALERIAALSPDGPMWAVFGLVLLAMPLNWGLESFKWRMLVSPLEDLGWWRAFMATLAGTSIGLFTPNRTGEFVGRVLFLEPRARVAGAFSTALGGIAQFVVTLLAGGFALVIMQLMERPLPWPPGWPSAALVSLTGITAAMALPCYLYPGVLRQLLLLLPLPAAIRQASQVLDMHSGPLLRAVLWVSVLRYLVFSAQFAALLMVLPVGVGALDCVLAVPVVYLIATLVPTVMLTELGVRGSVALAMLTPMGGDEGMLLLASFLVWGVNLLLPAILGSSILLLARIKTRAQNA